MQASICLLFVFGFHYSRGAAPRDRIFTAIQLEHLKKDPAPIFSVDLTKRGGEAYQDLAGVFWWQSFPLTGLWSTFAHYPYLPHTFSLWELAPALGAGITTTLIDTGVFGWDLTSDGTHFSRHPDLLISGEFLHHSYNTCPHASKTTDSFEDLVGFIASCTLCPRTEQAFIRTTLPLWINEYVLHKTTHNIDDYLRNKGKPELFTHSFFPLKNPRGAAWSPEGERVRKVLIHDTSGLGQFTPVTLNDGTKAFLEFLPLPYKPSHYPHVLSFSSCQDHATHTASIIGARGTFFQAMSTKKQSISWQQAVLAHPGLCGFAPYCSVQVIKALHEGSATTTVSHISNALARATQYGADIVNLSLRIEEVPSSYDVRFKKLEEQLAQVPFLCCAAGNEAGKGSGFGYPARLPTVTFSVGSFGCIWDALTQSYRCPLSSFSQYQEGVGPHFVAPGECIVGCSSVCPKQGPLYALRSGTSYATAYISGCLTLILGEFKNAFTAEQITAVCQHSCFRLHATPAWKTQVTYGALDVRTALFLLHTLQEVMSARGKKFVTENFTSLLKALRTEITAPALQYGTVHGITHSFTDAFMDYYCHAISHPVFEKGPACNLSLKSAVTQTAAAVLKKQAFSSAV